MLTHSSDATESSKLGFPSCQPSIISLPSPPSFEHLSTLHPEERGLPWGGFLCLPRPQAVPGPLVPPKQGHTVSRHTGHRRARGRAELCLTHVPTAAGPLSRTPESVPRIRHSRAPRSCLLQGCIQAANTEAVCLLQAGSLGTPTQIRRPKENSMEVPGALTHS